jgi:hypothetical protein
MINQSLRKKVSFLVAILLSVSIVTSCSNQSADVDTQDSAAAQNPLTEMTFATDSTDAYRRACYWGSEGDNIFLYERIKEGNSLAEQEGKLPLTGLEQAMEIVLRKGEPQAPEQYEVVKSFCADLGFPFLD